MITPWISPVQPVDRVAYTIAHTPEFAWVFRFLQAFPSTSVALVGSSVRDAITGKVPHTGHILITNFPDIKTQTWIHNTPPPAYLRVTLSPQSLGAHLASRTFTPNALAYVINQGTLHDPFGALDALTEHILTTVSSPLSAFAQHPLKALQALRLSAQLHLTPSAPLWRAILAHAPRVHHITTNEQGRAVYTTPRADIVREALLALQHGQYGLDLFSRAQAVPLAFPHLTQPAAFARAAEHFSSIHDASLRSRYTQVSLSDTLMTAGLFNTEEGRQAHAHHAASMHHAHVMHPRLNFSSAHVQESLKKSHILLNENPSLWSLSRAEKILLGAQSAEALSLAHIATLHDAALHEQAQHIARAASLRDRLVRDIRPKTLLRGRDLLPIGVSSGPHIRMYLDRIRDEQLKGDLLTKEDALAFVRTLLHA